MCGRFVQCSSRGKYEQAFGLKSVTADPAPSYNVCPTQEVLAVAERGGIRRGALLRWGLVPSWAEDTKGGAPLINARSESVAEKPSFRDAFRRRRCILPMDGIYEWERSGPRPAPHYMRRKDGEPFGVAGVWDVNTKAGETFASCAMLTCDANPLMARIHIRMPVILDPAHYALWLDPTIDPDALRSLLRPYEGDDLELYAVSPAVNKTANNGPELIEPLEAGMGEGILSGL